MKSPLTRVEKRMVVLLLLLCLLPVGVSGFIERRSVNPPVERGAGTAPVRVSTQTLAKYKDVIPLGSVSYIRLGDQGWGGGTEGSWDVYVSGHNPRPIEAHPDTPQGWRVEFVEELPDWETSGAKTIGVRVTVPRGARQAIANGVTAGIFHTRDGVQHYFADPFQVAPGKTHGKATHSRAGRAGLGDERANASAPGRIGPDRRGERHNARNRRGVVPRSGNR